MPEVVIIGAGLTGLSAAYHLEQNNFFDFEIYEKESRPGGLMRSEQQDDFIFDYTGHYLHVSDPLFYNFLATTAGIDLFDKIERQSAIYTHDTFIAYPFQMNLFGLPTSIIYDCLHGYIQRSKSRKKIHTFYDWVLKYFGRGLGKHFFFPYNEKLLAYPIKKIHHAWTGRFVPTTSLSAMLKGALEKNPHGTIGYNSSFLYPKHGGIESFIKKLVAKISQPIRTDHTLVAIDQTKKIITFANGHTTTYKTLITTAPLDTTLTALRTSPRSTLKKAIDHLWCNTVINFNLGFSAADIGPYHWLYFPESIYPFYRIGFWNNISSSLVKPQHSGIYGELSYQPRQQTRISMQKTVDRSITKTLEFLGLTQNNISAALTLNLNHGYVTYDAWREKNIKGLLKALQDIHVLSTGRFGAWKYSSMQEAFSDGKEAAEKILEKHHHINKSLIYPARHSLNFEHNHKKDRPQEHT